MHMLVLVRYGICVAVFFFLISMVAMICCYILNKEMIEIISIILIVVHCIAIFASIFAVERKLKRNFDKEGKRI